MKIINHAWLSLLKLASKKTKNAPALHRAGVWAHSNIVRANVFLPPPRVLLNTPPKSGTHLLSECLSLMPRMAFSGRHFALANFISSSREAPIYWDSDQYPELDDLSLRRFLGKCPQGMFAIAHASFHPGFGKILEELQFKQNILLRDPRDVAVSHAYYVKHLHSHPLHKYYVDTLKSDEERILADIMGSERGTTDFPRLSIHAVFDGFMPWLDDPATLVVRFEDLVGPLGGGDRDTQLAEIKRIGDFVERHLEPEQVRLIAEKMYAKTSATFRKGQIGDWQNHFTETHRCAFKEVAGETLIKLGYENDMNW
jgi:hypothetical protein